MNTTDEVGNVSFAVEDVPAVYKLVSPKIEDVNAIDLDDMYDLYQRRFFGNCIWFRHVSPYIEDGEIYLEIEVCDVTFDLFAPIFDDVLNSGRKLYIPKTFTDTFRFTGEYEQHNCVWEVVKWDIPEEYKKYFTLFGWERI